VSDAINEITALRRKLGLPLRTRAAPLADRRQSCYVGLVAKQAITTTFLVAPTDHGWAVDAGDERLGLFVTQRQALDYVKKRRARLTANGQRSTVLLTGHEHQQAKRTFKSF
jgi:hypothetical protein